jgi:hypothetical protein
MGKAGMPERPPQDEEDDDWKAAEKALEEARRLKGSQRFEALKRAGQLRYDAHKKLREKQAVELRGLSNDRGAENEAAVDSGTEDGEETRPPRR